MTITSAQLGSWIGGFLWPFMRIAMVLTVAPIFGARLVPVRVRIVLAVLLTWMLLPVLPPAPVVDPLSAQGVLVTMQQLLIGILIGFVLQMLFAALVVGGQTVALSMGLGFASMVDPQNGIQVPVVSQVYLVMATLLFLAMNGHLALIGVLADSFHTMPVGAEGIGRGGLREVVAWAGRMFAGGVLIALPAVTALLLINLSFGVITRAAPQLNIFGVGFPLTICLGFVVILFTLPGLLPQVGDLLREALALMRGVTGAGG